MRLSLGLSLTRGNRAGEPASYTVDFTGLTDGEARPGDHASIGFTTTPSGGTITQKWGSSLGGSQYGTGANPTDYTAGDGGSLFLEVTRDGEVVNKSAPIRRADAVNTVAPVASGDTSLGDQLSVTNGTWTGAVGGAYSYQWQRDGVDISGATSNTYTIVVADDAADVRCVVTYTNSGGAVSANSNAITIDDFAAPVNTVAPVVSGNTSLGDTLSVTNGTWTANPAISGYTYQWKRNGTNIGGETGSTYDIVAADDNATITCEVTATNPIDSTAQISNGVSVDDFSAPSITGVPTISGTEEVGQTLTATAATVAGNPTPTRTWQWVNSASGDISGATSSTYTLQASDEGDTITVRQTETNGIGSDSATSAATGAIAASSGPASPVSGVFVSTFTGQSLSYGTFGTQGVAGYGDVLYNGIMLDPAYHLKIADDNAEPRGNTFITGSTLNKQWDAGESSYLDALAEIVAAEGGEATGSQSFEPLLHNVSAGNQPATGMIGTAESFDLAWLPDVEAFEAALTNESKTLSGHWVGIRRQGEADNRDKTDPGFYKAVVISDQAMRTSDIARFTGENINFDMITYQLSSHADDSVGGVGGPYTPYISLALLDLCRDETLPFYLSNPTYYLPHNATDNVHLTGESYNRLAANEALIAKRLYWDDARLTLEPLAIRAAWVDGNDIILRYAVESGRQLVFDTTLVTGHTNNGFELYESDGSTPITITGTAITGTNEVTISTGSSRSAGEIVRYAYTPITFGEPGVSGPTGGPRGNLRDDTPLTFDVQYGSSAWNLYRWAAIDEFTVSASSGEPAAWTVNPHATKSLSQIATDYSLTGLFDIHTDIATSQVNHAGTDGTITGSPTFADNGATFGSGIYLDTGIPDTEAFTLIMILTPEDIPSTTNYYLIGNYSGGGVSGSVQTAMYFNRFTDRPAVWMRDNTAALTVYDSDPTYLELNDPTWPYMAVMTYDGGVDTTSEILLPRYWQVESDDLGANTRPILGNNWIVGNGNTVTNLHLAACADYKMSYEEIARCYRDLVYNLRDNRSLYI